MGNQYFCLGDGLYSECSPSKILMKIFIFHHNFVKNLATLFPSVQQHYNVITSGIAVVRCCCFFFFLNKQKYHLTIYEIDDIFVTSGLFAFNTLLVKIIYIDAGWPSCQPKVEGFSLAFVCLFLMVVVVVCDRYLCVGHIQRYAAKLHVNISVV